ncbi:hypothetical protein GmHk_20G057247 [Glycine max]|nr:hypothetical protein GmHk_20G057247 [Glycine max]
METKQHPRQQSPPIVASMHDEGLQPHAQSYEFMPQLHHHHQEDYGYNPQFFNARREDFMSNPMGTVVRISESAYTYIQNEGIMFESPSDPKVITISEDMSLAALRKTIFYANRGYKILINFFYRQSIYVSNSCVAYDCMELKHNSDVGKMFFIYLELSTKGLIKMNATFGCSPDEILTLLYKPRKPRTTGEIIALINNESM